VNASRAEVHPTSARCILASWRCILASCIPFKRSAFKTTFNPHASFGFLHSFSCNSNVAAHDLNSPQYILVVARV
jgi:hypothetical protein